MKTIHDIVSELNTADLKQALLDIEEYTETMVLPSTSIVRKIRQAFVDQNNIHEASFDVGCDFVITEIHRSCALLWLKLLK